MLQFAVVSTISNSFRSLLFPVNRLLLSGKVLLRETEHKGYLSASLESAVFLDFTHQGIILAILLQFICMMNGSLPILIFMIFPVLANRFRHLILLNYQMKYTGKIILYKTTSLNLIPVCPIFSYCIA